MMQRTLWNILFNISLISLVHGALLSSAWAAQAIVPGLKVGIVDLDRALKDSTAGKQALETLKKFRDGVLKEISEKKRVKETKETSLRDLQTELTTQNLVLSEAAKRDKEETYRRQVRELQRYINDSNRFIEESERDLRERESELTSRLLRQLVEIIKAIGKEENFTIIFEKNERFLLFAADAIDLTDKIIKRFDTAKK